VAVRARAVRPPRRRSQGYCQARDARLRPSRLYTNILNPFHLFSQVEADAGQFSADPRVALSVPEKRPFFLDGSEQFAVPSSLIYTRRIVQPAAAAKLTGKMSGVDVALLSAVDDRVASRSGREHPVYNVLRLQRDVGGRSRVGVAYTDRVEGGDYNRVADVDGPFVFRDIYSAQFQLAGSVTRRDLVTRAAPL
jgi:hypothetical protein